MLRTKETAEIIASEITPKPEIIFTSFLREVSSGVYENRPFIELNQFRSKSPLGFLDARPENGESFNDMKDRILNWFSQKLSSFTPRTLIVTHRGPMSVVVEHCENNSEFNTILDYNVLIKVNVDSERIYRIDSVFNINE